MPLAITAGLGLCPGPHVWRHAFGLMIGRVQLLERKGFYDETIVK